MKTWAARYASGSGWVAAFNSRPRDTKFAGDLDRALLGASQKVTTWPTGDLFDQLR